MKKILNLCLLLLLCFLVYSKRKNQQNLEQQVLSKNQQETVVEANHFSSLTQRSISYTINQIVKDKPILFYIKPHLAQNIDKTLEENPITIFIKDGTYQKQCLFKTYTQLCVVPNATSQKMDLKIECKSTPCQLSWEIIQPSLIEEDGQHDLDHLVSINKEKDHASLKVSCSNIELGQEFGKDLILYTNSNYEKVVSKDGVGLVFFLFDNPQEGFYFLTTENQKVKNCANASLIHLSDQISFNNDKSQFLDYMKPNKVVSYPFTTLPDNDFRIQALAYDLSMQDLDNTTSIKLSLVGFKSQNRNILSQMTLSVDNQKTYIQFSVVYKKPHQKYDKMEFQIQVFGRLMMLRAHFVSAEVHQIELGEISFFDLKKGEKIQYSLVPLNKDVKKLQKMFLFPSDTNKFKASQSTCPPSGCKFTLEAQQNGLGNIYIGEGMKRDIAETIIEPFQNQISGKISFGEMLYYSYDAKANQAIQLLINVPGVVVYAATKQKCPTLNQKCYQTSFNHHFPAIYQPKKDNPLIFKVVGLDSCEFTLRVVDGKTPFIKIEDTKPFTYLFDDKESSLIFQFQMKEKEDVSFNLIGPVNQLNLFVLNQEIPIKNQDKDWSAAQLSSDGFIKFNKDQIKGLSFAIKVEKRTQFSNKFIHFTLIASTRQANLRLEPGAAHYETLKPKDTRDYVFEFQTKSKIMLNFYTHNIHGKEVKLGVHVSNADQYSDSKNTASFTVDRNIDVLDIALASTKLCKMNEGQNCELFVRVQNQMEIQADVTITLLVQDSIIELKDGIWQSYRVNGPSTSSHFYFLPKHQNHSATIFYKPSVVDLRIVYNVWKSDDLSINLSEWPFPVDLQKPTDRFKFKPLQYIHIQPAKLKDCWPNCVILMSMITNQKDFQEAVEKDSSLLDAHFRIMASNNYIELPQKHKVDILLSKNESKELLVDLKYYLEKEQLTFLTHHTLGKSVLKANVYSESNPRCPVSDGDSDFTLDAVQTSLQIEEIKKKLQENSMQNDKNLYLCLIAYSEQDTKFNIEYDSNTNGFKKLSVDTTTTLKASGKQYLYYLDYSQETYIKVTRNEGFPFYKVKMCKPQQELDKCFDQFLQDKEQGTQLANKVTTIVETPCPKCLLLLKVQFKQQTEIVLHTQSKFTQLQLAANSLVADYLQPNEQNRYTLTGTKDQEIIINLQVTSGDVKVGVKDFQKIDIAKVNQKGSNNIHITVPPKDMSLSQKQLGQTHMSSFGLSTFVHLHITVESQDHSKPASYTITYSSGSPVVNLQDGLITEYNLIPKVQTKFIYKNPSDSPIYLYTSTISAQSLKKLKLKYYGLQNLEDEEQKVVITPQKSQFAKKTVNPTNLVKLQSKKAYFFTVTNQNDKNTLFTIGVNNRQIIYLPFDHEFPIELPPAQYIYLVINAVGQGYIKLTFSKCSISHPTISYTMNYDQFINQDYSIEDQMTQDLVSEIVLKVKSLSGIYIKVKSSDSQRTLMSIKAVFSPQKIKGARAKAGDKGLIQYQLLDSTRAEMTFSSVVCSKEQIGCGKGFNFFALTSDKIQNIYSQLVCPSIMFNLPQIQQLKSPKITSIVKGGGEKITFTQQISNDIEYVGVKAVNQKTGEIVYYHPVEIVTFWGQLHRSSQTTIVLAIFLIGLFGCGCLMVYRRYKKNQYNPVGQMNDVIEQD